MDLIRCHVEEIQYIPFAEYSIEGWVGDQIQAIFEGNNLVQLASFNFGLIDCGISQLSLGRSTYMFLHHTDDRIRLIHR